MDTYLNQTRLHTERERDAYSKGEEFHLHLKIIRSITFLDVTFKNSKLSEIMCHEGPSFLKDLLVTKKI